MFTKLRKKDMFYGIKRKTIIVSIYYSGDKEPITWYDDDHPKSDSPDSLFLTDAIEDTLIEHNPESGIFDVCIDHTKPWLFSKMWWLSRQMFKLVRTR